MLKNSSRIRWYVKFFLCFFLMILLPVIVFGTIAAYYQEKQTSREILSLAEGYVNAIEGRMNSSLINLENQILRVNLNTSFSRLDINTGSYEQKMLRLAEFRVLLEEIANVNPTIARIGFYYHGSQKILTNNGYYSLNYFPDSNLIPHISEQLIHTKFFIRIGPDGIPVLSIAKAVSPHRRDTSNFSYIDLSMSWIQSSLQEYIFQDNAYILAILDMQGNVIASTSSVTDIDMSPIVGLSGQGITGTYRYVSKFTPATNLNYVCLVPERFITQQASLQKLTVISICLSLLLVGIILAIALSRYIYSPLNRLVNSAFEQVQKIKSKKAIPFTNDISFVGTAINEFTQYSAELENMILSDRSRWINSVFSSLLKGSKIEHEELSDMLEYGELTFEFPHFRVLRLFLYDTLRASPIEYPLQLKYQISSSVVEFFSDKTDISTLTVDTDKDYLSVLVNHNDAIAMNSLCQDLHLYVIQCSGTQYQGKFLIASGVDTNSLERIYESALSSDILQKYISDEQIFKGVLFTADLTEPNMEYLLFSSIHIDQITSYLKNGEIDGINLLVENLFDRIEQKHTFTLDALRGSIIQMLGFHLIELRNKSALIDAAYSASLYHEINAVHSAGEMRAWLIAFYSSLTDKMQTEEGTKKESKVVPAVEYIHTHFHEAISLTEVAEMLNVSPQHLSTIFKQVTGLNFTDYINRRRMDEAAKMISETNKRIADIAIEVGYNNYNYFNKRFKEYFGVTPAQLRK